MLSRLSVLSITATVLATTLFMNADFARAEIIKKPFEYNLAGKKFEGYLAYDDQAKGSLPGVLVAHNWMGVTDQTTKVVDQLAQMGYVAFAVDIYGKGVRPKNTDEAGALAGGFKKDRTSLRGRMQQGLKVLRDQKNVDKNKIAVIGYCFGGTAAIELARAGADVKAIVSFHGGLDSPKPEDGGKIKGKLLALHGADDPYVPATDLVAFEDEMRKNKVDWQLIKYGGAVHSFTEKEAGTDNSKGAAYNEKAATRSWLAMRELFAETIGAGSTVAR